MVLVPLQRIEIANDMFRDLTVAEDKLCVLGDQLLQSDSVISQLYILNKQYYKDSQKYRDMVHDQKKDLRVMEQKVIETEQERKDAKKRLRRSNYTSVVLAGACALLIVLSVL